MRALTHDYVRVNLMELSGEKGQALGQYKMLQQKLRSQPDGALKDAVNAAVVRLSHS
jgi:hypothetical protein